MILLLLVATLLTACGKEEEPEISEAKLGENQIYIYTVKPDRTDLVEEVYTFQTKENVKEQAEEVVQYLSVVETTEEHLSPIPDGIIYQQVRLEAGRERLEVAFQIAYDTVDADTILLFKAAVVKSLLQLDGVNTVALSLTDLANIDPETATVTENFDTDSFVMSFGKDTGYKQSGNIILYFANESGDALREYRKQVEISNNTSLARVVVEALIQGPDGEGYQKTLPEDTTIQNISVKDGICYVDLSDAFYSTENPLHNDLIVYSVVNSLVELPTISKVQFLKNGERQPLFRETMEFDGIFERNLDLIEQEGTEE